MLKITRRKRIAGAALLALSLSPLAACGAYGESHNHNAPAPTQPDIVASWVRIQSPGNYHTVIRACVGHDGMYLTQNDGTTVVVVPHDPNCPGA
jgi:hypothetical protein